MKRIRKIAVITSSLLVLLVALAPLALYSYTLSSLNQMPKRSTQELSAEKVSEMWAVKETCTYSKCSSITPYWIYRMLFGAAINDFVTPIDENAIYGNVSLMASEVAIEHIRQGDLEKEGMVWWHLKYTNLGIWIQRNWDAKDIAEKYNEIFA